jgi:hypothetical protein
MGMNALINWRTLSEPFDKTQNWLRKLVRSPKAGFRPILMRPDWAPLVLATFAGAKVARLPGFGP